MKSNVKTHLICSLQNDQLVENRLRGIQTKKILDPWLVELYWLAVFELEDELPVEPFGQSAEEFFIHLCKVLRAFDE